MKRPIQKERGAILIMAAFILVILLGVAAFALDLGRLFVLHTEMQNAVDAAVLSAAVELDGEAGALERAQAAANQDMLNHLAHFSRQGELLENLQGEPDIFTFYTWIGSSMDTADPPSDCTLIDGKCLTTSADNAHYVQITLDPALFTTDDGRYEIDLYFLPALSLVGIDTATTASTRVVALAGSHYEVCNYPPMFICDPSEGGPALIPGQMVKLKEQGPGASWVAGTFGWLIPTEVAEDTYDDGLTSNRLLAHRLGSIYGQGCAPPIVEIKPGNIAQWPRWGLNTRFGIYDRPEHRNETFPSAPNVIDYPRDDDLTFDEGSDSLDCEDHPTRKIGDGDWDVSECNTASRKQPSTFGQSDFNSNFHQPPLQDIGTSRLDLYNRELETDDLADADNTVRNNIHPDEVDCPNGNQPCRILGGDPTATYVDATDVHKRRELFVAAVACEANDVGSSSVINMEEVDGKWMRFFMTEHVNPPPSNEGVTVYAEFIEEVIGREDEHFRKVIQLYE